MAAEQQVYFTTTSPQHIPAPEQPRTRLLERGPTALSDAELLALVMFDKQTTETLHHARQLLETADGWAGLQRASADELVARYGVSQARATRIKAAFELGRRLLLQPYPCPIITSPANVANLLLAEMSALEQEHLRVVLLNTKNHVLAIETIYIGTINQASVRICEVFKPAIRKNAAALVVVHNHPSTDPTPSPEDVAVTRQLIEAGKLLDMEVLDHLVIGQGRWVSLRERRLAFQ